MSIREHFGRFLDADPDRLHFAAHSHHPWPDVSLEAHTRAWLDAAARADDKWDHVFGEVVPRLQQRIASLLGLGDPTSVVFAPNTHDLVVRIFSCIEPPVRVLTSDSEFHSFSRQLRRWEEAGLAIADRVPVEPFEDFPERFTLEARAGAHDLVYLSQVMFNSGYAVPDIDRIVSSVPEGRAFVVIDGYHAFMARPVSLGAIQERVFFLAGGYKYAMSGEGVCFMHAPPGYGLRPVDTGWYAGFGDLQKGIGDEVPYATGGARFYGATFDVSGVYRMDAVLGWLDEMGIAPKDIHAHVSGLQRRFLSSGVSPGRLVPPDGTDRGNFLTFETRAARSLYEALHDRRVITDVRGDRIRFGFGIYHEETDVDRLVTILDELET